MAARRMFSRLDKLDLELVLNGRHVVISIGPSDPERTKSMKQPYQTHCEASQCAIHA